MQILDLFNFSDRNIVETSQLAADAAVAATALTLAYSDNIADNDYLVFGRLASEGSELRLVGSVTDATSITTDPLTKPHSRFDAVTKLFGNQIQVYRAANVDGTPPADSDFSPLGSPIDIDIDQDDTQFTDDAGGSIYWYKYTFFNSQSLAETPLEDCIAARGGNVGNYCSIQDIREEAGLQSNRWISNSQIDEKRQAAQQEVNGTLTGIYTLPFTEPINPLIRDITKRLAAGLLLTSPWGGNFSSTSTEGKDKLTAARANLARLDTKELVLTDQNGQSIANPDTGGVSSWPDDTTGTDPSNPRNGAPRMFTTQDRY